jgi:hypothetical protein
VSYRFADSFRAAGSGWNWVASRSPTLWGRNTGMCCWWDTAFCNMNHECKQLYAEFSSICTRLQWRRQCSGIVSNNAALFFYRVMNGDQYTELVSVSHTPSYANFVNLYTLSAGWTTEDNCTIGQHPTDCVQGWQLQAEAVKSYVFRLKMPSSGYSVHRNTLIIL